MGIREYGNTEGMISLVGGIRSVSPKRARLTRILLFSRSKLSEGRLRHQKASRSVECFTGALYVIIRSLCKTSFDYFFHNLKLSLNDVVLLSNNYIAVVADALKNEENRASDQQYFRFQESERRNQSSDLAGEVGAKYGQALGASRILPLPTIDLHWSNGIPVTPEPH
jgi:hypothetical protein